MLFVRICKSEFSRKFSIASSEKCFKNFSTKIKNNFFEFQDFYQIPLDMTYLAIQKSLFMQKTLKTPSVNVIFYRIFL